MGAKRIGLIGFDMKPSGKANHFHGNHSGGTLTNPNANLFKRWIGCFSEIHKLLADEGVKLINCSRETALTIPRMHLNDC